MAVISVLPQGYQMGGSESRANFAPVKVGWYRIAETDYYEGLGNLPHFFADVYVTRGYYHVPPETFHMELGTYHNYGKIVKLFGGSAYNVIKKIRLVLNALADGKIRWVVDIFYDYDRINGVQVLIKNPNIRGEARAEMFASTLPEPVELESTDSVVYELDLTK